MSRKKPLDTPRKLALVSWLDTYYDDEVHTEEQLKNEDKTCLIHSVGFLIDDGEDTVTVAMDFCPHGTHYRHVCRIRKENIRKIQEIG